MPKDSTLLLLMVPILAGSWVSCGSASAHARGDSNAEQTPEVSVVRAARRNLARSLIVSSELVPFQQIDVYAKESGFVQTLNVDFGTHVRSGQVMAVLEIPELQIQLDEDQADVSDARTLVARAQDQLRAVAAEQTVTHLQFTRLDDVAKTQVGLVAQQEVDDWEGKDLAAQAQLAGARTALESAESQLMRAEAKLRRDRAMFDYSKITAPFAGVVTKRYANLGTLMQSGINSSTQALPLVQLSQEDLYRLVIPVSESYVPDIQMGEMVDVRVPSLQRDFAGKVARFSFDLDESTRTMHTEVDVPNPQGVLMPGMYAEATLEFDRRNNVVAVPPQAVNIEGTNRSVWVIGAAAKVEHRRVTLGVETPDYLEVLSGLNEGELVAVGDRSRLRAGEIVRPKEMQLVHYSGDSGR